MMPRDASRCYSPRAMTEKEKSNPVPWIALAVVAGIVVVLATPALLFVGRVSTDSGPTAAGMVSLDVPYDLVTASVQREGNRWRVTVEVSRRSTVSQQADGEKCGLALGRGPSIISPAGSDPATLETESATCVRMRYNQKVGSEPSSTRGGAA